MVVVSVAAFTLLYAYFVLRRLQLAQLEEGLEERELRKAIAEDPRNTTALLLLGRALTTMGNYAEAERVLRRSLDVSPNGFVALPSPREPAAT